MTRSSFRLLAFWAVLSIPRAFASENALNENPALLDASGKGVPDGWTWSPPPNGDSTIGLLSNLDGVMTAVIVDRGDQVGVGLQQIVPVTAGKTYRQAAEIKGDAIPFYIQWLDASKKLIGKEAIYTPKPPRDRFGSCSWAQIAPQGAKFVRVAWYSTRVMTCSTLLRNPTLSEVEVVSRTVHPWEEKLASLPSHPRLLADDALVAKLREQAKVDPVAAKTIRILRSYGDWTLGQGLLVRKMEGKRLLGVSRAAVRRILTLALLHRLDGDAKWLERAVAEMKNVAEFENWNPGHFLDVAEMTAALSIGYDWLYKEMTHEDREVIRGALVRKGLEPSLVTTSAWPKSTNNWNQVCHGAMALASLAVMETDHEVALTCLRRAAENMKTGLSTYGPDGAYPEGPGYWDYGTTYSVLASDALRACLGEDFGIRSSPGFLESAAYMRHVVGPTGLLFNYADCPSRPEPSSALAWMARERRMPGLLDVQRVLLSDAPETNVSNIDRFLPLQVLFTAGVDSTVRAEPLPLVWSGRGGNPVWLRRSDWTSNAAFLAVKGGGPGGSHAHMDGGNFVFDADGQRWAADLGMQSYITLESKGVDLWNMGSNSQRWKVYRIGQSSHNVPRFGERDQRLDGNGVLLRTEDSFAILDLATLYEADVSSFRRGARLRGRTALIVDEMKGGPSATKGIWGFTTSATFVPGEGGGVLSQNGKSVRLRVLSPSGAPIAFRPATGPSSFDIANPGMSRVEFEFALAPGEASRIAVAFVPDGDPEAGLETDLSKW